MHKMITNLMMVNKIIIFCDSMIDDDINGEYFSDKLNFDINFINSLIANFWDKYLKFIDIKQKNNFLEIYFFVLKRFYKLLYRIKKNRTSYEDYNVSELVINDILESINNKIKLIKEQDSRAKLSNTEKQCINEEEYSLLFENFEQEEQD